MVPAFCGSLWVRQAFLDVAAHCLGVHGVLAIFCLSRARCLNGLAIHSPFFLKFMVDLFALTQEALAGLDVELVDVERAPMGLLRVTIDRSEGVRIEDCEQVSRHLSRVFEVEDIDYNRLEVGSPGTDRPLRTLADFARFNGERVEVRLREPIENRKVFRGWLQLPEEISVAELSSATPLGLEYQDDSGVDHLLTFNFDDVDRAKLDPILDFKGKKR